MPYYRNRLNRKVTVFIKNSIPVKFYPNESKLLTENGLDEVYPRYIERIPDDKVTFGKPKKVKEQVVDAPKKEEKKTLISEVKQPTPDKELVQEPVEAKVEALIDTPIEEAPMEEKPKKKKRTPPKRKKKQKISEGYNQLAKEVTVAGAGSQEN